MDVNQAIVKILEQTGKVNHVFGSTGQVNASMLLALRESESIETIVVRNEQAASFMACGYAMYSQQLGVCFATGGPGAFNLFSGLAVAYSDSLPVMAITGYTSSPQRGKGALNESTGLSRTPDSHKMFCATTKKSFIVEEADKICDIMEEALNIAYDGRPGPVHIHVPKNITTAEVHNFREVKLNIQAYEPKKETVSAFANRILEAFSKNEKVVLLVGYGCIRSGSQKELLNLVNRYQIPFMTTMDGKGYLPENHELSLGVFGSSGDPLSKAYFNEADVILALGNSFAENATFSFKPDLFDHKTLMHINIDKDEINKVYHADYVMISDIKPALLGIAALLGQEQIDKAFAHPSLDKSKKWVNMPISYDGNKIHPGHLCKILSETLPENAIVLGDAGAHMLWLSSYMSLDKNQRYQNPGSFGPMASHTNGAMGVKCANPDKVVISACGDGCYMMAGLELLTAVQNNIPVVWVIFNNGEFNIIKKFLINMFNDHAFMDFINPDYCKYAEACGATGYRVEKLEDFKSTLEKAIALNKPVLIDVVIENEVYPPISMSLT